MISNNVRRPARKFSAPPYYINRCLQNPLDCFTLFRTTYYFRREHWIITNPTRKAIKIHWCSCYLIKCRELRRSEKILEFSFKMLTLLQTRDYKTILPFRQYAQYGNCIPCRDIRHRTKRATIQLGTCTNQNHESPVNQTHDSGRNQTHVNIYGAK